MQMKLFHSIQVKATQETIDNFKAYIEKNGLKIGHTTGLLIEQYMKNKGG